MIRPSSTCLLVYIILAWQALAQTNLTSKRGISYIVGGHETDYNLLLSARSPLTWYYTWLPTTAPSDIFAGDQAGTVEFVPTIHNATALDADLATLARLPASARRHLFTFNEPDGTFASGGSALGPTDAVRTYVERLAPLREQLGVALSHPATTGSPRGMQWLRDFNAACWWYAGNGTDGDVGLGGRPVRMWVTELGVPGADQATNYAVMAQTLPYLDQLDYVERYAWFGEFRLDGANNWTGPGLALFENDGGLTDLGALYLGGELNGFFVGDKGQQSSNTTGGSGNSTGMTGGNGTGSDGGDGNGTGSEGGDGNDNKNGGTTVAGARCSLLLLSILAVSMLI